MTIFFRHLRNVYTRFNSIINKFTIVKLHLFHAYCCKIYCFQLWVNLNKGTYLKAKVDYNDMHTWILGSSRWSSASSMCVNNAIDTFYVLRRKNISGIETYF